MLYLNNPLLTSEGIISYFEENLRSFNQVIPEGSTKPSPLSQLKNKLQTNFFHDLTLLNKKTSNEEILNTLANDPRFTSNYPKLKQVLCTILALTDTDDKTIALTQLKAFDDTDWNPERSHAQFEHFNTQHGYFNNPSSELHTLYTKLAIACRTMIVLFEKNNSADDTMAYDYAYKLMALFVDPAHLSSNCFDVLAKETYDLLTNIDSDKGHPFHEALLVKLQLPDARKLNDLAGWRNFIKKRGSSILLFFINGRKNRK